MPAEFSIKIRTHLNVVEQPSQWYPSYLYTTHLNVVEQPPQQPQRGILVTAHNISAREPLDKVAHPATVLSTIETNISKE